MQGSVHCLLWWSFERLMECFLHAWSCSVQAIRPADRFPYSRARRNASCGRADMNPAVQTRAILLLIKCCSRTLHDIASVIGLVGEKQDPV